LAKPLAKPGARTRPAAEPVIPLVLAPDDPGPDSMLEPDPVPEPSLPPPAPGAASWQRILHLFR